MYLYISIAKVEAVASRRWCCWPLLLSRAAGAKAAVGLEIIKYDSDASTLANNKKKQ